MLSTIYACEYFWPNLDTIVSVPEVIIAGSDARLALAKLSLGGGCVCGTVAAMSLSLDNTGPAPLAGLSQGTGSTVVQHGELTGMEGKSPLGKGAWSQALRCLRGRHSDKFPRGQFLLQGASELGVGT